MIKFKATKEQVAQICANAINASLPMGMGIYQYNPQHTFTAKECLGLVPDNEGGYCSLDYVEGRMVKMHIKKAGDSWEINNLKVSEDYQSWGRKYPTYDVLLKSVAGVYAP